MAGDGGPTSEGAGTPCTAGLDGSLIANGVTIEKPKIIRCQRSGPEKTSPDQCDHQSFFEDALAKAVLENTSCAPKTTKGGTVSFAVKIDHKKKTFHLWAGKSGSISKKRVSALIECVQRAIHPELGHTRASVHGLYHCAAGNLSAGGQERFGQRRQ